MPVRIIDLDERCWLLLRTRRLPVALRVPVKALLCCLLLGMVVVGLLGASLATGSYTVSLGDVWQALIGQAADDRVATVVREFRLPRTLVAVQVGVLLALSGVCLQGATRNGLADPSLVGISQGASLAVITLIILLPSVNAGWRPVAAFLGALLVAGLIQALASRARGGSSSFRFILIGIGIGLFLSALVTALLTYGNIDRAQAAMVWQAGGVHAAGWNEVRALSIGLLALFPLVLLLSRPLSALQMGEQVAQGLGVSARFVRNALICMSVALAASATAAVGPLGFVGLIAPHAARRLAYAGPGLRLVIAALTGALLVLAADLLGRTVFAPVQIPAGLITALVGVPFFLMLLYRPAGRMER